jgi:hypothetical protein
VLLTTATMHVPATDLGYLLHKNLPDASADTVRGAAMLGRLAQPGRTGR